MVVGEAAQRKGEDGARRAKQWLDATTRVQASYTNDGVLGKKLSFTWPHGGRPFSYDLGGILKGENFEGQFFVAEVKAYDKAHDQGTMYDDWLAKGYVALTQKPDMVDHLMWITWSPFRITDWAELMTPALIRKALELPRNKKRLFDADPEIDVSAKIDDELVSDLASRLWIIVLSDKQEKLVISAQQRGWITAKEIEEQG